MHDLRFSSYSYYPALRTRRAEMRGLSELDSNRKRKVLPLITLGEWPRATSFEQSLEAAVEAMEGLPFIADMTTDLSRLPEERQQLIDCTKGFQAWRQFTDECALAIPTVIITAGSKTRDVVQQAVKIEETKGKVAFRIRDFPAETPLVIAALSALDNPQNAIIFIDCLYIRGALAAHVTATIATLNSIRREFPESIICILSTSFPASTMAYLDHGRTGSIEILERDLFARIGGRSVAIYGDHGSVHSVVYDDVATRRWSPRIDFPTFETWHMERRPSDDPQAGYIDAAKAIVQMDPLLGTRNIWGEQMIIDAASGNPYGKAPASWISVRVNIHLSRQIDMATDLAEGNNGELDDFDGNG